MGSGSKATFGNTTLIKIPVHILSHASNRYPPSSTFFGFSAMDLADLTNHIESLDQYHYPPPDEPHPIADEPQRRRIAQVRLAMPKQKSTQLVALVHGYGPTNDFARRFKIIAGSSVDGAVCVPGLKRLNAASTAVRSDGG